MHGWLADASILVCYQNYQIRPNGPGVEIYLTGADGGGHVPPPSSSVEDFAAKSVRPCHMVSGVHYRYSEGLIFSVMCSALLFGAGGWGWRGGV